MKSMYAYQLRAWFEKFDKSRFHIITLEQYSKCDICELRRIIEFLGLDLYDSAEKNGYKDENTLRSIMSKKWNVTPIVQGVMDEGILAEMDTHNNLYLISSHLVMLLLL